MTALLDAALAYARSGWFVFPVEPPIAGVKESGKRPLGALVPNGKDDATTDERLIRSWWERVPNANIGIACAPSKLVVLDVDIGLGKKGRESLAEIDAQLGDTLTAQTGSGGIHAYHARPDGVDPFTSIGDPRKPYPAIDLIGNGYVVAPPSLHYTGGSYSWARQVAIADMPQVFNTIRAARSAIVDVVSASDVGQVAIAEGGRNNALFKLGAALRATGIDRDALRAALHLENRRRFTPPLPDDEVETVAASVMTRVHPERDVALGAVVQDEMRDLFAGSEPEPVSMWARDVAALPTAPMRFYSTGNVQLDTLLGGGFASSHVCGIVGPPSVGKSAFVGDLVQRVQGELPILHVSTELTRRELLVRYAASRACFRWRDGLKGKHDDKLVGAVDGMRIKLIGSDTLDLADPITMIAREAFGVRDELGIMPGIVIDYVQLLARGGEEGMRSRVGELTKKIRILAQALDVPVLAVFSTGRAFYGSGKLEVLRQANDPTAYLSAAKESGDVEFDCATILYLDVDQLAEGLPKPARAVVARCRVGDIGFAGYRAHLDTGRWVPDPLACVEMLNDERGAKRQAAKIEIEDTKREERFLEIAAKHDGIAWNELLHYLKGAGAVGGTDVVERVKHKLIESGKISIVQGYSKDTSRKCFLVRINKPTVP